MNIQQMKLDTNPSQVDTDALAEGNEKPEQA
jgi:hypothetical protein